MKSLLAWAFKVADDIVQVDDFHFAGFSSMNHVDQSCAANSPITVRWFTLTCVLLCNMFSNHFSLPLRKDVIGERMGINQIVKYLQIIKQMKTEKLIEKWVEKMEKLFVGSWISTEKYF